MFVRAIGTDVRRVGADSVFKGVSVRLLPVRLLADTFDICKKMRCCITLLDDSVAHGTFIETFWNCSEPYPLHAWGLRQMKNRVQFDTFFSPLWSAQGQLLKYRKLSYGIVRYQNVLLAFSLSLGKVHAAIDRLHEHFVCKGGVRKGNSQGWWNS